MTWKIAYRSDFGKGVFFETSMLRHLLLALVLLAGSTAANASERMSFFMETDDAARFSARVVSGFDRIYATGEITEDTDQALMDFVGANDVSAARVYFNSPGGSLTGGIALGRVIRRLGFSTAVGVYSPDYNPSANETAICASACAYAFAGGASRFYDEYSGGLGIHQFYASGREPTSSSAVQQISGIIVAYLNEMGVDTRAFSVSTLADRDGMIWLTPDQALMLRLADNGSAAPVAEIRLSGMTPYLRVEQEHHDVTARALFLCEASRLRILFGIVTDPTSSAMIAENQRRSYLELDSVEFLEIQGNTGGRANDSVVWIEREVGRSGLLRFLSATEVGGWIDGFGAVRYGATLQLPSVRSAISDFASQCYSS